LSFPRSTLLKDEGITIRVGSGRREQTSRSRLSPSGHLGARVHAGFKVELVKAPYAGREMSSVRRLTAILAADGASYSRLMGADEEGTHERLKAHLGALVDPKIAEHRGRIVKTTGDGMLVEFPSVVDAVRCAVEVQRGMVERNAAIPPDKRIDFRVGINLGDIIADGDDIFGDGVNIAARLEALAEPGGICISGTVRDHIGDRLPYTYKDRGEQSVKNIARPVRVYALRTEGAAYPPASRVPAVSRRRRSAVVAAILMVASMALVIAVVAWWAWPATRTPSVPPGAVAAAASCRDR
jgi:adenylate cyclase